MSKMPIRLRTANQEDIPFIFNSWLKSYRSSTFAKGISSTVYFSEHHKVIRRIIDSSTIIIACNEEEPSQIYGWICAGKTDGIFTLHYTYVKKPFRNFGLGKQLLNAFEHDPTYAAIYTHQTTHATRLAGKYNFVYHPYVLFSTYEDDNEQKE
jgi:GNAT superfamily N-acetyltransferase